MVAIDASGENTMRTAGALGRDAGDSLVTVSISAIPEGSRSALKPNNASPNPWMTTAAASQRTVREERIVGRAAFAATLAGAADSEASIRDHRRLKERCSSVAAVSGVAPRFIAVATIRC